MKENKIIGICCLIISVICLIGAYYFKVFEHEFLWNLALGIATGAVSYTHLTLPTICSV